MIAAVFLPVDSGIQLTAIQTKIVLSAFEPANNIRNDFTAGIY